jgi:hemerythrin-like domain-containing protein
MGTLSLMTEKNTARATTVLRREHQAILRMLDTLRKTTSAIESGEVVPQRTLDGLLEFFTVFADRCHQVKEEEILFPMLERKGLPRSGGPIAALASEHLQGRALLARMKASAPASAHNPDAALRFTEAAGSYAGLLQEHISKENTVLYMMAERLLTDSEQRELAARFDEIDDERLGIGNHERTHVRLNTLSAEAVRQ